MGLETAKTTTLSLADMKARMQSDIDAVVKTPGSDAFRPALSKLREEMLNKEKTKKDLADAIKQTAGSLDSVDPRVQALRTNLNALATALEEKSPAAAPAEPAAAEKTEGVKAGTETAGSSLVTLDAQVGLKINVPVIGPALDTAKKNLPDWAQIPIIGGVLWTGMKGVTWLMKNLGLDALAKPVDFVAHVVGEVGFWSGAWTMLDKAVAGINAKKVESH